MCLQEAVFDAQFLSKNNRGQYYDNRGIITTKSALKGHFKMKLRDQQETRLMCNSGCCLAGGCWFTRIWLQTSGKL